MEKKCGKCGKAMRLSISGSTRQWECRDCFFSEPIDDEYKLSISEMAVAILADEGFFSRSDDFKKKQANIRRILGGLRRLRLDEYLASEERAALSKVINVLDRFGDAAEKAKKLKKAAEDAEKARVSLRQQQAETILMERYSSEQLPVLLRHGYVMSLVNNERFGGLSADGIRHFRTFGNPRYEHVAQAIRRGFNDEISSLASGVAYSYKPLKPLVDAVIQRLEGVLDNLGRADEELLNDFNVWLVQLRLSDASNRGTKN